MNAELIVTARCCVSLATLVAYHRDPHCMCLLPKPIRPKGEANDSAAWKHWLLDFKLRAVLNWEERFGGI